MTLDTTVPFIANDSLRVSIAANLDALQRRKIELAGRTHAAVAITLVNCQSPANIGDIKFQPDDCEQAAFILTIRSAKLTHHKGQRAFPGGRIDAGETPEQAALRELHEEVGLQLDADQILGSLDDYATRSGFVITPVVVWGGSDVRLQANPDEVASIHRIPLRELMRPEAPLLISIPESEQPVLRMPLGNAWFAAPSAAIAYQFREVGLLGLQTRVAHFEEPQFAWR